MRKLIDFCNKHDFHIRSIVAVLFIAVMLFIAVGLLFQAHASECADYEGPLFESNLPFEDCIRIRHSKGGAVKSKIYMQNYDKVIIDGVCMSACVHLLLNNNTCFTRRAKFYFHGVYDNARDGKQYFNFMSTIFYKVQFPKGIQRKITDITIPGKLIYVSNKTMRRYMPNKVCGR